MCISMCVDMLSFWWSILSFWVNVPFFSLSKCTLCFIWVCILSLSLSVSLSLSLSLSLSYGTTCAIYDLSECIYNHILRDSKEKFCLSKSEIGCALQRSKRDRKRVRECPFKSETQCMLWDRDWEERLTEKERERGSERGRVRERIFFQCKAQSTLWERTCKK